MIGSLKRGELYKTLQIPQLPLLAKAATRKYLVFCYVLKVSLILYLITFKQKLY